MKKKKYRQFGWHDFKKDTISMIYPRKFLVEMCSPDGFKSQIKHKEGNIVELECYIKMRKSYIIHRFYHLNSLWKKHT